MQVLLNTVEKKSHGKRHESKRMQKCLGSFEQKNICNLLSFKSQKSPRSLQFGLLLSKTAPEVTAATLLFIWMSLNMARPQTNWKGSTASVFANVQYSCLQPWYCGIIGTRVVSYANMAEGWEKRRTVNDITLHFSALARRTTPFETVQRRPIETILKK